MVTRTPKSRRRDVDDALIQDRGFNEKREARERASEGEYKVLIVFKTVGGGILLSRIHKILFLNF